MTSPANSMTHSDWQTGPVQDHSSAGVVEEPSVTVTINNVVTLFNCRCHLNLKHIARSSVNVEFKPDNNMVVMRMKKPYVVASIWSSGKVWCTGATSADLALKGARRIARRIMRCGYPCKFSNFRTVNILATCEMPFGIRLTDMIKANPKNSVYEPELHPALNYSIISPKASLRVFSTGSLVITGPSLENIGAAVEHIYPIALANKMENRNEVDRVQYADSVRRMKRPHWSRQSVTGGGLAKQARVATYSGSDSPPHSSAAAAVPADDVILDRSIDSLLNEDDDEEEYGSMSASDSD